MDLFTAHSGRLININTASANVLQLIPDVDGSLAQAMAQHGFAVEAGEIVSVIGPNGAGKSTLFKAICGLVNHTGEVEVNGVHCHSRTDRMDIAYIPQRSNNDIRDWLDEGGAAVSG